MESNHLLFMFQRRENCRLRGAFALSSLRTEGPSPHGARLKLSRTDRGKPY